MYYFKFILFNFFDVKNDVNNPVDTQYIIFVVFTIVDFTFVTKLDKIFLFTKENISKEIFKMNFI